MQKKKMKKKIVDRKSLNRKGQQPVHYNVPLHKDSIHIHSCIIVGK